VTLVGNDDPTVRTVTSPSDVATGPSPAVPVRNDLRALVGYHSPQLEVEVRLNTNESPVAPPERWLDDLSAALRRIPFNRYPDRRATALRQAVATYHGVEADQVLCGTGSNEVLQCLLLAYGGAGRRAVTFEPSYTLHRHIAQVTATEVVSVDRRPEDFSIDLPRVAQVVEEIAPTLTFVCSPNNPTGRAESLETIGAVLQMAPGLVVVDEAYGQFAPASALQLVHDRVAGYERLVVVRTFSKTFSLAAMRLGYMVADSAVVAGCDTVVLPYNVDAVSQAAGCLALQYVQEMEDRVGEIVVARGRLEEALKALPVTLWPSDANFILFRPDTVPADDVWAQLVRRSVLVRNCSGWPGLYGCLRVTVGTPPENDRFVEALTAVLA